MAVIKPTVTPVGRRDNSNFVYAWLAVTEADTCMAIEGADLSDKSIHVSGTFGGASVALFGSNNSFATTGKALRDPSSTVIAITAEDIKQVLETTQQIKPVATGGAGQSLNIYVQAKQTNPLRQ